MKRKILNILNQKIKKIVIYSLILLLIFTFLYLSIKSFQKIVIEVKLYFSYFLEIINYPILNFGNSKISIGNILIFFVLIYVGFLLGSYYKRFIYILKRKNNLSHSTTTILANVGYYAIVSIIVISSLKIVGIDLSSFALIAGALSVGIGFGLQNIVSNFVSGIILMFEKSITVGDYIELSDEIRGTIIDIKMRSITIKTNDNIDIVVPNQKFIQNDIINRTLNDKTVRFRIPFDVAYGVPVETVEKVILQALEKSKIPHLRGGDYEPMIVMKKMNDSSVDYWLYVWVRGDEITRPNRTSSEFLKMIYTALNENNITIPFPQTDLHIKDSVPLKVELVK